MSLYERVSPKARSLYWRRKILGGMEVEGELEQKFPSQQVESLMEVLCEELQVELEEIWHKIGKLT